MGGKTQIKNDSKLGEEEKMTEMTTNDNTRLNEKIVKSKKMEQGLIEKSAMDKRMMVKCASEPRMFIKWEEGDVEEEEIQDGREEMVIEEF